MRLLILNLFYFQYIELILGLILWLWKVESILKFLKRAFLLKAKREIFRDIRIAQFEARISCREICIIRAAREIIVPIATIAVCALTLYEIYYREKFATPKPKTATDKNQRSEGQKAEGFEIVDRKPMDDVMPTTSYNILTVGES